MEERRIIDLQISVPLRVETTEAQAVRLETIIDRFLPDLITYLLNSDGQTILTDPICMLLNDDQKPTKFLYQQLITQTVRDLEREGNSITRNQMCHYVLIDDQLISLLEKLLTAIPNSIYFYKGNKIQSPKPKINQSPESINDLEKKKEQRRKSLEGQLRKIQNELSSIS